MLVPEYGNANTKKAEQWLGKFLYEQADHFMDDRLVIVRGAYQLDNNAIYTGEWNTDGLRHGKGIQ